AAGNRFLDRFWRREERVCPAVTVGVGGQQNLVGSRGVVQRIEQRGGHRGRIAKGRVRRHIADSFAVDKHRASVSERGEVFVAGLRTIASDGADIFRADRHLMLQSIVAVTKRSQCTRKLWRGGEAGGR